LPSNARQSTWPTLGRELSGKKALDEVSPYGLFLGPTRDQRSPPIPHGEVAGLVTAEDERIRRVEDARQVPGSLRALKPCLVYVREVLAHTNGVDDVAVAAPPRGGM